MTDGITLKSLAPILIVDAIGPSLPFWTDRLGFAVVAAVPEAAPYDFVIVARDGVEVMLQTRASAAADTGDVTANIRGGALYLSVGAIDPVLAALGAAEIVVPRRTTFYGADEVWVRDPAGNLVGFAASWCQSPIARESEARCCPGPKTRSTRTSPAVSVWPVSGLSR